MSGPRGAGPPIRTAGSARRFWLVIRSAGRRAGRACGPWPYSRGGTPVPLTGSGARPEPQADDGVPAAGPGLDRQRAVKCVEARRPAGPRVGADRDADGRQHLGAPGLVVEEGDVAGHRHPHAWRHGRRREGPTDDEGGGEARRRAGPEADDRVAAGAAGASARARRAEPGSAVTWRWQINRAPSGGVSRKAIGGMARPVGGAFEWLVMGRRGAHGCAGRPVLAARQGAI